jgi:hypothetical protein
MSREKRSNENESLHLEENNWRNWICGFIDELLLVVLDSLNIAVRTPLPLGIFLSNPHSISKLRNLFYIEFNLISLFHDVQSRHLTRDFPTKIR